MSTKIQPKINPTHDRSMIEQGLRPAYLEIDRSTFAKSAKDKKVLKARKKSHKSCIGS